MFGKIIERSCPVAESSNVIVSLPSEEAYSIFPTPALVDEDLAIFDSKSSEFSIPVIFALNLHTTVQEPLDISLKWQSDFEYRQYIEF